MKPSLILIIPFLISFRSLPKSYRGYTTEELARRIDKVKLIQSAKKYMPPSHRNLMKKNLLLEKEIQKFKLINRFSPSFDNEHESIATFERFKGVIDGNIISSGHPVNFKVDFIDSRKIPNGSYLSCTGTNLAIKYNYRIMASCDRLVTPRNEYQVAISIKDTKKVDGIEPDHVYTGDEEAIIGEGFSSIMAGIIDARKERVRTAINFTDTPTIKNAYLNGIINAAKMANRKAKNHTSERTVVLAVKDKKEVIIEFKRRFSYEEN